MDFRKVTPIGARIRHPFKQLLLAHGYDHNWVLNKPEPGAMSFAAEAYDPWSGRIIRCYTTEPGIQVYAGNCLDGTVLGSSGTIYRQGRRLHPRNAALPGFAQRAELPFHRVETWPSVPFDHDLPLLDRWRDRIVPDRNREAIPGARRSDRPTRPSPPPDGVPGGGEGKW